MSFREDMYQDAAVHLPIRDMNQVSGGGVVTVLVLVLSLASLLVSVSVLGMMLMRWYQH